ncbi:MAG: hypothetical protein ABI665_24145 [Vicinamibacterales bacterium]
MKRKALLTTRGADLIRWQFRMRNLVLTCGVSKLPNQGFSVVTLPHWDIQGGVVETFLDPREALQRHAAIVDRLRATGWSIAAYTR